MTRHTIILNSTIAAALLLLLVVTGIVWSLHLGTAGVAIGLGIAVTKAMLIAIFFMELRESSALTRLFAVAGLYWLAILIVLTLTDVLSR